MPHPYQVQSRPVIAGNLVIWPTDRLRAYDLATGAIRWEAGPEIQVVAASMTVALGTVVVGVPGRIDDSAAISGTPEPVAFSVVGIDAATGVVRWSTPVDDATISPVVANGIVFMTVKGSALVAIDVVTGNLLWERDAPSVGETGPAVADGIVTVTLGETGTAAYTARTGELLWSVGQPETLPTPNPAQSDGYPTTGPAMGNGLVVYGSGRPLPPYPAEEYEDIIALDATTGAERWRAIVDAFIYEPVSIADGTVYVQGGDGIRALNAETGSVRWQFATLDGQAVSTAPTVVDGVVYTGGHGQRVYALNANDGAILWSAMTWQGISGPVTVGGDIVVVASGAGDLRAIDAVALASSSLTDSPPRVDVFGIPPCTVPPREALDLDARQQFPFPPVIEGTPSATLVEPVSDEYGLLPVPVIRLEELPAGSPADSGTVAALEVVAAQLESCARLSDDRESIYDIANIFQDEGSYVALFSDDFLRRPWAIEAMGLIGYEGIALQVPVPAVGDDVRVLSDGRVAVLSPPSPPYADGAVYLFVEQDGQWLIDEFLAIASS